MREGAQLINRAKEGEAGAEQVPFGDTQRRSASLMFVPVHAGGAVVGILSIQSYTPAAYSHDDLKLLQAFADLCGDALERIKVTEALREAEAKYRGIFEHATEGIFQTTSDGRLLSANPALARMFGFESPEEMIASVQDIGRQGYVIPEKREQLKRLLDSQESVRRFEAECYRKDGSVFWTSLDAHAVRDAGGTLLYYEGINHDITEIVRAREALARSHEELEKLVRERTAQLEAANQSLRSEIADRKRLERQVLERVEREQERIGQDLHDGLCQLLTGIKFKAASLGVKLRQEGALAADQIRDIEDLANQAIRQGYGLARGLNPVQLPGHGLTLALKALAASIEAAFDVNCICNFRGQVATEDQTVANHLYRIAQEAIHNAIKHGKAREISVSLRERAGQIALAIEDDGAGFPLHTDGQLGMGLHNMKARAGMIGASLDIRAGKSRGTVVTCLLRIPIPRTSSG
jgi:PAS domain S-box-containing protein